MQTAQRKHRYETPAGRSLADALGGYLMMRERLIKVKEELECVDDGGDAIESLVFCRQFRSDPTAYAAIHYRDLVRIERAPLAQEAEELRRKLSRIKMMLMALNEPERFVAIERYIKSKTWPEVVKLFNEKSGDVVPPSVVKALRNGIYRKLAPFLEEP